MATRTRLDSAQAAKQKTGADAGPGRRTTGTVNRSISSGGKSTSSVTPQRSPSYPRATQNASRTDPSKPVKKESGVGPTKPTPAPNRRQSVDRAQPAAQTQRLLSAGTRERSVTVKSPSLSSTSKTTASRAELGKPKMTTPKPMAPTRAGSGSGSGSRSGSIAGRTVKKSSTPSPSPSPKPERTRHMSDAIEAEEKSRIIVDEEKLTPPPPQQPVPDDHGKLEDEPLEHDAVIEEEGHIHNQEEHEEKEEPEAEEEEEEHHHESTLMATLTDEEESSKETEAIEADEENHHDTTFQKSNENHDLEDIHYENHDHENEPDHEDEPNQEYEPSEGGEGTITKSPTEQPPLEKFEPVAEVEEKPILSPDATKEPKPVSTEGTGDSIKIEPLTISKSPLKPQIRAQNSSLGKKDSPVSNDVIKEAAGKLLEKRKNRVSALVGAFETVISLQEPDA